MKRFCVNCGEEVGDLRFCPKCGTPTGNSGESNFGGNIGGINIGGGNMNNRNRYILLMAFPIVYLILLLCAWFKISIPFYGTETLHIYDLVGGINNLVGSLDEGSGVLLTCVGALFIILAIIILYMSVRVCISAAKNERNTLYYVSWASIISIIEAVLAIVAVLVLKGAIESEIQSSGLGSYMGKTVSDCISTTPAPIVLIITAIIGQVVSQKFPYMIGKNRS